MKSWSFHGARDKYKFALACTCTEGVRAPLYGLRAPAACWVNKPTFRRKGKGMPLCMEFRFVVYR